jgi:hypothetical protein
MIALPPGCRVVYPIWIDIQELSDDVIDWYHTVGGDITYESYWDYKGKAINTTYVRYGKGKRCHHHHNGVPPGGVRLHFNGEDASVASMFILKFNDIIDNHNLKEQMERVDREPI